LAWGAVGAAVEHRPGLAGLDGPILHHAGLDGHHRRVARVAGHQLLDVVHDHLHRAAGALGQVVAKRHVHERPFASEVAADGAGVEHDTLGGDAPGAGKLVAQHVGVLVVGPDLHLAGRICADQAGVGFDVRLMHQLGVEGVLKYKVRFLEPLLDVALLPGHVGKGVPDAGRRLRQSPVGLHIGVQVRGVRAHGLFGVVDRGQFLVHNIDQQQGLVGGLPVDGGDGGHLLAHETHHVLGQHRHVDHAPADPGVGHVPSRDHGVHARQRLGLGDVDADDACVGVGAAEDPAPEHARQ